MGARLALALALAITAGPGTAAPKPPTRLFTDDSPIHIALKGPLARIAATPAPARTAYPATLSLISPMAERPPASKR